MKRAFNYTGRVRLSLSDISIHCERFDDADHVRLALRLEHYRLPEDARIFVEAYRQMEWMRFDFGAVGQVCPPPDTRLARFESLDGVLFRIRIVASSGAAEGRLVAEADRLAATRTSPSEGGRRTLLPVEPRSLAGELFRLDMSGEQPVLLIERELGGSWQAAAASPVFEALVYPQILRTIVGEMLREGWPDDDDEDNPDGWQSEWAALLRNLPGFTEPPDGEDAHADWVHLLVELFCHHHGMIQRFNAAWEGGQLP